MKQKIIFFDIDGTLMDREGLIPDSTKLALEKLKEAGHLRFICTGRTKSILPKKIVDCNFDGYVMGAGTHIEYKEEKLVFTTIPTDMLRKTTEILRKYDVGYALEGPEYIYIEKESLEDPRAFFSAFLKKFGDIVKVIEDHNYESVVANKLTVVVPEMEEEQLNAYHREMSQYYDLIIHEVDQKIHGRNGLEELMPKGYNKGTGIERCIEKLQMDRDQTIGVGDSNNDLDMLNFAHEAICMGNGTSQAKEIAAYVTTSIDEDGIYNAMEYLKLI